MLLRFLLLALISARSVHAGTPLLRLRGGAALTGAELIALAEAEMAQPCAASHPTCAAQPRATPH